MSLLNLNTDTTNLVYLITDRTVAIARENQVVTLPRAVHKSTLVITQLNGETWDTLVLDTDYSVTLDDDAQSLALLEDDEYSDEMVRLITLVAGPDGEAFYQIRISGVTLEPDPFSSSGVLSEHIGDLISPIRCLEVDLDGGQVHDDNHIINEHWWVSTPNGKQLILPACGPFYAHDVVIVNQNGVTLTEGEHYHLSGVNHLRTTLTHHPNAVYDVIVITIGYTGDLYVSYRAFGGDYTREDGYQTKAALETLRRFFENDQAVTANNLPYQPIIEDMTGVIGTMSQQLASLWTGGYGGVWSTRPITVLDDDPHWYTFATLTTDRSGTSVTSGSGMFRVAALDGAKFDCWFHLDVDLARTNRELLVTPLSCHNLATFDPVDGNFLGLSSQTVPLLRLVWRVDDLTEGCFIQIKLAMTEVTEFGNIKELMIENRSAATSNWRIPTFTLIDSGDEDYGTGDLTVDVVAGGDVTAFGATLGAKLGDVDFNADYDFNGDNLVDDKDYYLQRGLGNAIINLTYKEGLVLFAGSISLDTQNTPVVTQGLIPSDELLTSDITSFVFTFYDRYTDSYFEAESYMTPRRGNKPAYLYPVGTHVNFYAPDMNCLKCVVDALGYDHSVRLTLTPFVGNHSLGRGMTEPRHQFDLVLITVKY